MTKSTSFDDVPIFVYPGSLAVEIVLGAKNYVLLATKTARNNQIEIGRASCRERVCQYV